MKTVTPGSVQGDVDAPPSKSMAQRALAVASLIADKSVIEMGTPCDDTEGAIRAAGGLGSTVEVDGRRYVVHGKHVSTSSVLNCGESGLSYRMFCAVASVFAKAFTLEAEGPLQSRPMAMVQAPLTALGVQCATSEGLPPVTVQGPLMSRNVTVDATTSSQFLTGLLIALCFAKGESVVKAPGLKSKPYVQMTLDLLRHVGADIEATPDLEQFTVHGKTTLAGFEYRVPGDWSGASFLLAAGAIAGDVTVRGLDMRSSQADQAMFEVLKRCNAGLEIDGDCLRVFTQQLQAFEFDATHCPDLFPPLAALAANCNGVSKIKGVHRLAVKECDREAAIIEEFGKLNLKVRTESDVMFIDGGPVSGGCVEAHGDHRMAMSMAIAALKATGPVSIEGDDSITKSYPDFFDDMVRLGAVVS